MTFQELDEARWARLAAQSAEATFFHTPHWAQIAQAAEPVNEPFALGTTLDDGVEVAFPFVRRRQGDFTALLSTFAGCYGGPVASRALTGAETAALAEAVAEQATEVQVVLGPTSQGAAPSGFVAREDVTSVLELDRDFDAIVAGFHPGHRRAFTRSAREGVTARRCDAAAERATYTELYDDALGRWGEAASSRYRPETFDRLAQLATDQPDAVALWLAEHDGRAVAAAWAFYWNGYVSLWHGVARRVDTTMISPPTLLYGEIVRDAIERGCRVVDFNPSGGHAGSHDFKRRLGTVERPVTRLRHVRRGSPVQRVWRRARRALAR